MSTIKSVLLAPNEQVDPKSPILQWPLLASVKYDGFRCICVCGTFYTRNMKPHRNRNLSTHLRAMSDYAMAFNLVFDMELYDHEMPDFATHQSILTTADGVIPPTLKAHVFDAMTADEWYGKVAQDPFFLRVKKYHEYLQDMMLQRPEDEQYVAVEQVEVENHKDLMMLYEAALEEGFEGLMLRDPQGRYKHGRATLREGIIFKFKEFVTEDGEIIEIVQRRKMTEAAKAGPRTLTPTGRTERLHTQASYELDDMVGCFKVRMEDGTISEVNYGRGFPHSVRREHWYDKGKLLGRKVEVRHQPAGASTGLRIGTLIRFRDDKA